MENKRRLEWLDVAKALGVYLVILGHLVIFNYHTFRFIFAFHMPFFFIAAGYVWKKPADFKKYFGKCCKYYLIPYLVILVLGLLQCILLPTSAHNLKALCYPEVLEKSFYGGLPNYSYFGSAWFLLAMFWAQLMFWGLIKIGEKSKKYITILIWIVFVLLAVFSKSIFSSIPVFERLPLKLDSAFMATVFIGIGVLLKKTNLLEKGKWYLSVALVLAGCFLTWLFGCKWNYYVNLADCDYAREYNYIIAAVAGSIMLFGLGQILKKSRLLQFMGRNTLIIFLSHEVIYILIINYVNLWFDKNFAGQSMRLDVWSVGISVVTLLIATLIAAGYQFMKKKISKLQLKEKQK